MCICMQFKVVDCTSLNDAADQSTGMASSLPTSRPAVTAQAPLLHAAQVGSGKVVKVTGIQGQGRTATILLRGSNKLVLEEAERSLHDALCVIRCLVQKRALIPGGAAPEMEVEHQLIQWAKTLQVPGHLQPAVI